MRLVRGLAVACLSVLLAGPAGATPVELEGSRVCRFADPRVGESSGLAVSTDGSVLWTHNDSGDAPRFFAVEPGTCRTLAAYRLDLPPVAVPELGGPFSVDWEDVARGRAADGTPVLLLADVGDNYQVRRGTVTVYEVAEPTTAPAADPQAERPVAVRAVHQLVYPGDPVDAEALAQLPDGRLVVVTKHRAPVVVRTSGAPEAGPYTGRSEVYVSEGRPAGGPTRMSRVAGLDVTRLPGVDRTSPSDLAVTGADLTRDGSRLVVRTYTTAYVWDVERGDLAAAVARTPQVVRLLPQRQGEAVAWTPDGAGFWTSSEGTGTSSDPTAGTVDVYRPRSAR